MRGEHCPSFMRKMRTTHLAIHLLAAACFYTQDAESVTCPAKYRGFAGHTACLDKSPTAISIGINTTVRNEILTLHNDLRGGVTPAATNMPKLSWDEELEMLAQRWTDYCDRPNGFFHHDRLRFVPGRFEVGQNLAVGAPSFTGAINLWYQEHTVYVYGDTTDASNLNPVGHYTQMMWENTTKIGCGLTSCGGDLFYVCNYSPPGNYIPFTGPYKSGTRGSGCQTVVGGLCDCAGLVCENYGVMDPKTCSCDCLRPAYHLQPSCQLDCSQTDNGHCGVIDGFLEADCISSYVSSDCPHTCSICPYAAPGYREPTTPRTTTTSPNPDNSTARTSSSDAILVMTLFATLVLRS